MIEPTGTYTAIVAQNGSIYLYSDYQQNDVKVADLIIIFHNWSEFFSVACGPAFAVNPFDMVKHFYIHKVS